VAVTRRGVSGFPVRLPRRRIVQGSHCTRLRKALQRRHLIHHMKKGHEVEIDGVPVDPQVSYGLDAHGHGIPWVRTAPLAFPQRPR